MKLTKKQFEILTEYIHALIANGKEGSDLYDCIRAREAKEAFEKEFVITE